MSERIWRVEEGEGPLVAAAIHDGHAVRAEVEGLLALGAADRLREEDPHTSLWTKAAPTRVVGLRSRFEVDLNRPRERAVYVHPEDAWGLRVWKETPPPELIERSLKEYDDFYEAMDRLFRRFQERHGRFVVLDLHSYNHRRSGPGAPAADESENPQVNIGTGPLDRPFWSPVVDRLIADLRAFPFPGGGLDVRENVKFRGGRFSRWACETFPQSACVVAIEWKKFFMDEWAGETDPRIVEAVRDALASAVPGILEELGRL
ncbi:MAG: N-formylglutamate amidohydrolase [Candidatus Eisenbacteria bacterium]